MSYSSAIQSALIQVDRKIGLLSTPQKYRPLLREVSFDLSSIKTSSDISLKASLASIKNKALKADLRLNFTSTNEMVITLNKFRLTKKELEILNLLPEGQPIKELAASLFLTEATVKTHLTSIYKKLGAVNRTQAISIAKKNELLAL